MGKTVIPGYIAVLARKIGQQFDSERDLAVLLTVVEEDSRGSGLRRGDGNVWRLKRILVMPSTRLRVITVAIAATATVPRPWEGDHGEVAINRPWDSHGTFEPQLIRKGQTPRNKIQWCIVHMVRNSTAL